MEDMVPTKPISGIIRPEGDFQDGKDGKDAEKTLQVCVSMTIQG
jgi:hypothetical protein